MRQTPVDQVQPRRIWAIGSKKIILKMSNSNLTGFPNCKNSSNRIKTGFPGKFFFAKLRQKRERHGLHFIQKSDSLVEVLNKIILFLKRYALIFCGTLRNAGIETFSELLRDPCRLFPVHNKWGAPSLGGLWSLGVRMVALTVTWVMWSLIELDTTTINVSCQRTRGRVLAVNTN